MRCLFAATLLVALVSGCDDGDDGAAPSPDAVAPDATTVDATVGPDALGPDATRPDAAPSLDATADATPPVDAAVDAAPLVDAAPDVDPAAVDPQADGPFRVGYRAFDVTYTPPGQDAERTVTLNLWYPTWAMDGGDPPRYAGIQLDRAVFTDAPPAAPAHAEGYPVMIYSHGDRGYGGDSAFLARQMASHGWVFAAPDHTGNTLRDVQGENRFAHYVHRPADLSASLDALAALPAEDPFGGRLVTDRVVAVGHSRGTYTMFALAGASLDLDVLDARCADGEFDGPCEPSTRAAFAAGLGDDRVVGVVPLAGGFRSNFFGTTGQDTVDVPVLWMTGTADPQGVEDQIALFAGHDVLWVDIEGGCHLSFTLGSCGTLPMGEGHAIIEAFVGAFGRSVVVGDDGAAVVGILDGSVGVSERVSLQRAP